MTVSFAGARVYAVQPPPDMGRTAPLSVNTDWGLVAKSSSFADPNTSLWGFSIDPSPLICDGRLGVPMSVMAVYLDNLYPDPIIDSSALTPQIFFQISIGSGYPTMVVWEGFLAAGLPKSTRTLLTQVSGLLASEWEIRARIDPAFVGVTPSIRLAVFFDRGGGRTLGYINGPPALVTQTGP